MTPQRRILVTGATSKVGSAPAARAAPGSRGRLEAMRGVGHVLHLSTSKETPESITNVAVTGLF